MAMATATKTRNTPAADAAAAVAGGKAKGAPAARSGTQVEMPDTAVFQRYGEFMGDVITPARSRILWRLAGGPCSAADLAAVADKTPNATNNHLKVLRSRGLIEATEDGWQKTYALTKVGLAWFKRLRPCLEPFAGS